MEIPKVNWPGESGDYKAIQMYVDEIAYWRFGNIPDKPDSRLNKDRELFNCMLMRALHDFGIFCNGVYPAPVGEIYQVVGTWKYHVDVAQKMVRPLESTHFVRSGRYPMGIDKRHLEAIFGLEKEWRLVNPVYVQMRKIGS